VDSEQPDGIFKMFFTMGVIWNMFLNFPWFLLIEPWLRSSRFEFVNIKTDSCSFLFSGDSHLHNLWGFL
jgi:hypothetical protein